MKIAVTGATGFIGKAVVAELLAAGHEVLALSRGKLPSKSLRMKSAVLDLSDSGACISLLRRFKPDAACHLAWAGIPDFSWGRCLENAQLSSLFFEAASRVDSCKKIIAAGSCWELGAKSGACKENVPCKPVNAFTWAKLSARACGMALAEERGFAFGWCRIFFVYGAGQRRASLLPSLLHGTADVKNPDAAQDFIYLTDVAEGFRLALEKDWPSGDFHFGSGSLLRIGDIANLVADARAGKRLKASLPSRRSDGFYASTIQSRRYLGWFAKTPFHKGLAEMIQLEMKTTR